MARKRAPYAPEFRRQIIELVRAGRTPEKLAKEFEPSAQAIRNWVAQADRDRPCARRLQRRAGRDGKTNSAGAEQKNSRKQEDKMPSLQIP